jgi:glycosyltransferase involved in cell wall biosynthesis
VRIGFDARLAWRRGVGTYTANLLLALSRVDSYNDYFVFGAPPDLKKAIANKRFKYLDPAVEHVSRLFRSLARHPAFYEQFWLPGMLLKHELDLLHYTDNSATVTADVPYVVTVHDTMFRRPLSEAYPRATFRQRLVDLYKKAVVPLAARNALAVLTVSEYSKKDIVKELRVPEERVFVTLEGVDREVFSPPVRGVKNAGKKGGQPVVLVHGAEDERKNVFNILKAASILLKKGRPVTVMILGMDEKSLERCGVARHIREWGLTPYLQPMGYVSGKLLPETYRRADVFLYASRWEGFGLPVLEAFACGVPVVASNATSLPEVAGEAALLVNPEKPGEIADAVERVIAKPAAARALVRKGFARVKQFTWDRTARMTIDVYRRAALEMEYDHQGKRIGTRGD